MITPLVQRQQTDEIDNEEEEVLQPKSQTTHSPVVRSSINSRIKALKGGGRSLSGSELAFFEPRFGYSFSNVRIHTGSHASETAKSVNAKAFTLGKDIVFGAGEYAPETKEGKKLLGHELTHVVQQNGRPLRSSVVKKTENTVYNSQECRIVSPELYAPASIQRACGSRAIGPTPSHCNLVSKSPSGTRYLFQGGCDTFDVGQRARLELAARALPTGATVDILGMASADGRPDFNESLSCHRADAAASVFAAAGKTNNIGLLEATGEVPGSDNDPNFRAVDIVTHGPSPSPTPTPPTPVPPAPSPTSRAACLRARHTECVMRLGGCSNTRPAGIPTEQEITSYNADCRSESGYTGPDVTPSDTECQAGHGIPSATDCRNARLEETHICGPDITQPLADVLADVRTTYAGWSPANRRQACDAITGIPIPFMTSGFIMAWDIRDLFLQNTGWLCRPPFHPPCGMPPVTDCDDENSSDCGNSVEVQNKCFLAGTVNYALFGQICRLCNDEFGVLSENTMENLIIAWKALGFFLDSSGPPIAWARCGFRGFPGHLPVNENRPHCRGRCPVRYPRSAGFTWIWEPHQPR